MTRRNALKYNFFMKKYDVIIVGGGAAGLACAAELSKTDAAVLVIEAGGRAGKKLSATGNGQGNIFNSDTDISHYRSGNLAVVKKIVHPEKSPSWACDEIFGAMLYKYGENGRAYPQSLQASSLTDILLYRLAARNAQILLSSPVGSVSKSGEVFCVKCGGNTFYCDFLVLATGGKAHKNFGTDGSAYALAESFGHKLTPLYPSIVQLKTETAFIKNLKGIRAECRVEAFPVTGGSKSVTGDVIFTDYGVSGSAVFYLSGILCASGGTLKIDFLPDIPGETLKRTLSERKEEGFTGCDLLFGIVHNQIARAIYRRAGSEDIDKIIYVAKNFSLEVTGTLGFDYAQVTKGGVDMSDISDKLESKLVQNLYFAGEILDVDGDCGGYNLNWAFSSGIAVADSISQKLKSGA